MQQLYNNYLQILDCLKKSESNFKEFLSMEVEAFWERS